MPRILDWSQLHIEPHWAYAGKPVLHQSETQFSALGAWRLRHGTVVVHGRGMGRELEARAGDWVLLSSDGEGHVFSEDADIISVRCRAAWPDGRLLFDLEEPIVLRADAFPDLDQAAKKLVSVVRRSFLSPPLTSLARTTAGLPVFLSLQRVTVGWLEAYARTLMALGHEPTRADRTDPRVLATKRRLDALPLDRLPPFDRIAREVGLSRKQLERLFSRLTGGSLERYFDGRRSERALRLLRSSALSVKEIAHRLGFSQAAAFTHWVRRKTGRTPSDLRRSESSQVSLSSKSVRAFGKPHS